MRIEHQIDWDKMLNLEWKIFYKDGMYFRYDITPKYRIQVSQKAMELYKILFDGNKEFRYKIIDSTNREYNYFYQVLVEKIFDGSDEEQILNKFLKENDLFKTYECPFHIETFKNNEEK